MRKPFYQRPLVLISLLLFGISCYLRIFLWRAVNSDTGSFTLWLDYLQAHGFPAALGHDFSAYPSAYLYLLGVVSWLPASLGDVTLIKIIPLGFDLLGAAMIFQLTRLRRKDDQPWLAAATYFILPTVVINSAFWGQVDSAHTALLLVCVYFLLREKPHQALIAFGIAISLKPHAIFMAPMLGILLFRNKIPWYGLFWIPLVYVGFLIPRYLLGLNAASTFSTYTGHFEGFNRLSMNAPNPYFLLNDWVNYNTGLIAGILIGGFLILGWMILSARLTRNFSPRAILFLALVSVALTPFVLPKMHDRYFYPADVFSFVVALAIPELWFVPVLYQAMSGITYTCFLFGAPPLAIQIALLLNTVAVGVLLWRQFKQMPD